MTAKIPVLREGMRLVLPPDVLIIPVSDLPPHVRARLPLTPDEFAVSRPRSRTTTQLIDADAARLLEEFRTPRSVAEAVGSYGRAGSTDAIAILDEALLFVERLLEVGILVPAASGQAGMARPSLAPGTRVDRYRIVRSVRALDDSEVYEARDQVGVRYALKIGCHNARIPIAAFLEREAAMLEHLGGVHAPRFHGTGDWEGRPLLAMSWCDGDPVTDAAEALRFEHGGISARLLDLCRAIVGTYAAIHTRGVVHGDVHPRNILVTGEGAVTLLDFGLARLDLPGVSVVDPGRGGIGFYMEPEYARARLLGMPPPAASREGEQYAVAALLYLLLTGRPYVDFSLERAVAWQQIVAEAPQELAAHGIPPWPEMEEAIGVALAKDPRGRYASMAAFHRRLGALVPPATPPRRPGRRSRSSALSAPRYLRGVLERWSDPATSSRLGPPSASVGFGAAGIAYLFYRAASLLDEPRLLAAADSWTNAAEQALGTDGALLSPALNVGPRTATPHSLYYGAGGVHAVRVLVGQAMGDSDSVRQGLSSFIACAQLPTDQLDLVSGRASSLLGCGLLYAALAGSRLARLAPIVELGEAALAAIWSAVGSAESTVDMSGIPYLGVAHGWAGILYATLHWASVREDAPPAAARVRLDELAGLAVPVGRGIAWPISARSKAPARAGWCHGSAGYVQLWTLADRLYPGERYLDLARRAARHTWEHPHPSLPHPCCGLAGQAQALLSFYKISGDKPWLDRARELGKRAIAGASSGSVHATSLLKGEVGVAHLACDLQAPHASAMPLFEREGWGGSAD